MAVNIKLSKEQQQYMVLAVLLLGGGGFAYVKYFWLPISAKIEETSKKISAVEGKIAKAKSQAVRLNKIQKELEELNAAAVEAERRLPKSQDLPGVIDTITGLANKHNVRLDSFSAGVSKPQAHFVETTYSLSGTASWYELGRFLAAVALEERIFNVRGVSYGAPAGDGSMKVSFQLVSYQYKG